MLGGYRQLTRNERVGGPAGDVDRRTTHDSSISVTQEDASRKTCSSYETPGWLGRQYKCCLRPHLYDVTEHQQLERQRSFRLVLYRHLLRRRVERSKVDVHLVLSFEKNRRQSSVGKLKVDRRVAPRVKHAVVAVQGETGRGSTTASAASRLCRFVGALTTAENTKNSPLTAVYKRANCVTISASQTIPENVGSAWVLPEVKVLHSSITHLCSGRIGSFWCGRHFARVHPFLDSRLSQNTRHAIMSKMVSSTCTATVSRVGIF